MSRLALFGLAVFGGDAPVQFGAQAVLEVVVGGVQHGQGDAGADGDAVFGVQAMLLLAVDAEVGTTAAGVDGDGAGGIDDDGTLGKGVRADGNDQADRQVGFDNGAAGSQGVGSRGGRGGDDEAVGAVVAEVACMGVHVQLNHARFAAVDDGVVDGSVFVAAIAGVHGDVQGVALFAVVGAGEDVIESAVDIGEGEVGEEAETAGVDADKRDLPRDKGTSGVEEGAVTADDDAEVHVAPGGNGQGGGVVLVLRRGGVTVEGVGEATRGEGSDQAGDSVINAHGAVFADDTDVSDV